MSEERTTTYAWQRFVFALGGGLLAWVFALAALKTWWALDPGEPPARLIAFGFGVLFGLHVWAWAAKEATENAAKLLIFPARFVLAQATALVGAIVLTRVFSYLAGALLFAQPGLGDFEIVVFLLMLFVSSNFFESLVFKTDFLRPPPKQVLWVGGLVVAGVVALLRLIPSLGELSARAARAVANSKRGVKLEHDESPLLTQPEAKRRAEDLWN